MKEAQADSCICYKSETCGLVNHPDELILKPDRTFYWIEFKLPYNDLSDSQRIRFKQLRKKGHSVYVVKDTDMARFYHEFEMNRDKTVRS